METQSQILKKWKKNSDKVKLFHVTAFFWNCNISHLQSEITSFQNLITEVLLLNNRGPGLLEPLSHIPSVQRQLLPKSIPPFRHFKPSPGLQETAQTPYNSPVEKAERTRDCQHFFPSLILLKRKRKGRLKMLSTEWQHFTRVNVNFCFFSFPQQFWKENNFTSTQTIIFPGVTGLPANQRKKKITICTELLLIMNNGLKLSNGLFRLNVSKKKNLRDTD